MILSEFWRKQAELGVIKVVDFAVGFAAEDAKARMLSSVTLNVVIRVESRLAARQ